MGPKVACVGQSLGLCISTGLRGGQGESLSPLIPATGPHASVMLGEGKVGPRGLRLMLQPRGAGPRYSRGLHAGPGKSSAGNAWRRRESSAPWENKSPTLVRSGTEQKRGGASCPQPCGAAHSSFRPTCSPWALWALPLPPLSPVDCPLPRPPLPHGVPSPSFSPANLFFLLSLVSS